MHIALQITDLLVEKHLVLEGSLLHPVVDRVGVGLDPNKTIEHIHVDFEELSYIHHIRLYDYRLQRYFRQKTAFAILGKSKKKTWEQISNVIHGNVLRALCG